MSSFAGDQEPQLDPFECVGVEMVVPSWARVLFLLELTPICVVKGVEA